MKKLNPITAKYLLVFLSIFIFTCLGQIIIQYYISNQKMNSTIVNLAGRQRMLSQKIAKQVVSGKQTSKEIESDLNSLKTSHEFLKTELPEEFAMFASLEPLIEKIENGVTCKVDECQRLVLPTLEASNKFLKMMDKIVFHLDKKFDGQINNLSNIEYAVFAIISFIMIYEFFWVLLPFQRKMNLENKKLIHAAKLSSIGQMSAGIVHEINNPLAIIHGSATVLKSKISQDSTIYMDNILDATDRIKKISEGLRRFSREEDQSLDTENISLNNAIEEAIYFTSFSKENFSKVEIISKNIEDFLIKGEKTEVSQVLVNLIGNSIDAIEDTDKPWIKITSKKENGDVHIHVTDSGKGVSKQDLSKIFEPFFTSKPSTKGTGLGLSLSRDIVRRYGGDLVYSPLDGHTSFRVTFKGA